ncbi:MAG: hypothetical protein JSU98_01845 [Gemmatimonadales bacterium]|nr:MAG: hypothetical protein JSU98_01845 [Gemmatimonadales bacterium]
MKRFPVILTFLALAFAVPVPLAAQYTPPRSQLGFELSPTWAGAITYARRMDDSNRLWGIGGGFAWELNDHSFDRQVWNVVHIEGFTRYQPVPWFQGDLGLSGAITSPADDTSETRTFVGIYAAAMVGPRFLLFGPQFRFGMLGSETGWIANVALRVVLSREE